MLRCPKGVHSLLPANCVVMLTNAELSQLILFVSHGNLSA